MKPIIIAFLLCNICRTLPALAQTPDKEKIMAAMQALARQYAGKKNLAFSISYHYAMEDQPGVYLDSLKGRFMLNGDRYRYSLDSTEFIGSKELSVVLFKSDKMIYLAKPSKIAQMNNPMAMLDSLLWKKEGVESHIEETAGQQKISLLFKPGGPVKRVEYLIDKSSGLVTRIINTIDSRQLYDPSVQSKIQGVTSYVVVEAEFGNYLEDAFPDSDLDPGSVVKKLNGQYIAQAPYGSYKIFLANPDL